MKYVYLILREQYMPKLNHYTPFGVIDFAFTSEKQAQKQMDTIVELVNQNKFYSDGEHSIDFDKHCVDLRKTSNIKRSIKINHPNGTYTIFTLQKVELNSGYGI